MVCSLLGQPCPSLPAHSVFGAETGFALPQVHATENSKGMPVNFFPTVHLFSSLAPPLVLLDWFEPNPLLQGTHLPRPASSEHSSCERLSVWGYITCCVGQSARTGLTCFAALVCRPL